MIQPKRDKCANRGFGSQIDSDKLNNGFGSERSDEKLHPIKICAHPTPKFIFNANRSETKTPARNVQVQSIICLQCLSIKKI